MTHPDTTNSRDEITDAEQAALYEFCKGTPHLSVVRRICRALPNNDPPILDAAHPQQAVAAIPEGAWILASNTKPLKAGMYRCRWSLYPDEEKRLFWDGWQWIGESWDGTLRTPVRFGMAEGKYEDKWFSEVDSAPQPTQQDSAQQGEKEKP